MKKLYTYIMLMAVAAFTFTAAAKSYTIEIDDPTAAYLIDTESGRPMQWNGSVIKVSNADDNVFYPTFANDGFAITNIQVLGYGICPASGSFPTDNCQIYGSDIPDGSTVYITTGAKEIPTLTITAEDPSILWVSYNYQQCQLQGNSYVVPLTSQYGSVTIASSNPDYVIVGAIDDQGESYSPDYSGVLSIYAGNITSSRTITVQVRNISESRSASMTVNVSGNLSAVRLVYSNTFEEIPLSGPTTVVKFDPYTEYEFCVQSNIYGKNLYKVELDGNPVSRSGSSYYLSASDGSVLNIETEFPAVDVPVSFTFGEGVGSDIINMVSVNGTNVFNWGSSDFSVQMGQSVYVSFNTMAYTDITVKHNGSTNYISQYSPFYRFTVDSEEPVVIHTDGVAPQPYHITLITDCPEGVRVYNGYGYDESELVELSGEETEFDIPSSYPYLYFKGAPGYIVESVIDELGNELYVGSYNYISSDMTIFVSASEVVRNKTATVYVEPGMWNYKGITLSQYNSDLTVQYTDANLPGGYNFIPFGDFDLPMVISGYPSLILYLNDQEVALEYGALNKPMEDGCVLKMFRSTPASYSLSYDIHEDAAVEVHHDHTMFVETPSVHSVFEGTEIVISPIAQESPVARVAAEREGLPVVKVDGEICQPNEDGKYVIAITKDTAIKVEPGELTGIDSVEAAGVSGDDAVYNLQGIRVGKASELKELPAGTYITAGGMKIRK
ncbi:MAG: hypothetical protein K2M06_06030 [Muribaculaceae bacterium]|nr:hypothetical protein [Muribaculaceae bacterium]